MTLVDRYLSAVRFFLPRQQQDDIVRELSENLDSEIEARADSVGRALSDAETAEILRRHGHPVVVAGRYRRQQQLIGPVFFPIYVLALKMGLAAAAAVTVVLAVLGAAWRGASIAHLVDGLAEFPGRALVVFAWTTIAFAVLDAVASRSQLNADWDPRRLPDWMVGPRPLTRASRVNSVADVVLGLLALGWLLAVPASPQFALGPLAALLEFGQVWHTWYVPLVLIVGAQLAVDVHALAWPTVHRRRIAFKIVLLGAQLVIAAFILSAGGWVMPAAGATSAAGHPVEAVAHWVNVGFRVGFAVVIGITVIEIGKQFYRLRTAAR